MAQFFIDNSVNMQHSDATPQNKCVFSGGGCKSEELSTSHTSCRQIVIWLL